MYVVSTMMGKTESLLLLSEISIDFFVSYMSLLETITKSNTFTPLDYMVHHISYVSSMV